MSKPTIEIPPDFGRDIKKGVPTSVGAWIDGAMPFRAETIRGYLQGVHQQYLADPAVAPPVQPARRPPPCSRPVFGYNQDFKSVYAMVPSTIAMLLVLIPAILMALAIVREKELGSITNFYVTPVTRIEFLHRQTASLYRRGSGQFRRPVSHGAICFRRPLKGSFATLALGALLYVTSDDRLRHADIVVHPHPDCRTVRHRDPDIMPATQFSGMLTPVSSLTGGGAVIGHIFPMTYFLKISVGHLHQGARPCGPRCNSWSHWRPSSQC